MELGSTSSRGRQKQTALGFFLLREFVFAVVFSLFCHTSLPLNVHAVDKSIDLVEVCVLRQKFLARLHAVAHQRRDHLFRFRRVLDVHLNEGCGCAGSIVVSQS